jgi:hypothetical protein
MNSRRFRAPLQYFYYDFDCGTVDGDELLHAADHVGSARYALCRRGRIRFALPSPFTVDGDRACPDCVAKIQAARQ